MAEDDSTRANEYEAERKAEQAEELERIDRDADEVADDAALGTQSAPREDADDLQKADGASDEQ